jgi:hypothetical protein
MPMPQDLDDEMSEATLERAGLRRQVNELRLALAHQLEVSSAERRARAAAENSARIAWRAVGAMTDLAALLAEER